MNNTPLTMFLVIGLPGAGKSNYVQKLFNKEWLGKTLVNFDDVRLALGHKYNEQIEPHVYSVVSTITRMSLNKGIDVVIDESITTPPIAFGLVSIAREYGAFIKIRHICTPIDLCRTNRVPKVMESSEFDRKVSEWQEWGPYILKLADSVKHENVVCR